jgi:hypothetical protein
MRENKIREGSKQEGYVKREERKEGRMTREKLTKNKEKKRDTQR